MATLPPPIARPCGIIWVYTSPQLLPGPIVTADLSAATVTWLRLVRSMVIPLSMLADPAHGVCLVTKDQSEPASRLWVEYCGSPASAHCELTLSRDKSLTHSENCYRERHLLRASWAHNALWINLPLLNGPVAIERCIVSCAARREKSSSVRVDVAGDTFDRSGSTFMSMIGERRLPHT